MIAFPSFPPPVNESPLRTGIMESTIGDRIGITSGISGRNQRLNIQCFARLTLVLFAFVALGLSKAASQEDETGLHSVPTAKQRDLVRAEIARSFDVPQQNSKSGRYLLSKRLLDASRSVDSDIDPIKKFVLLNLSREIAANTGDIVGARRAITIMEVHYRIDTFAVTVISLRAAGDAPELTVFEQRKIIATGQELLDERYKEADFENAQKLSELLIKFAQKYGDRNALRDAQLTYDRIQNGEALKERVTAARESLKRFPLDSAANWTIAEYELLHGDGWDAAAPYLKHTTEPFGISSAMSSEELIPQVGGSFETGQAWVQVASNITDPKLKQIFLNRALKLFRDAEKDFGGITPDYVAREIANLERQGIKSPKSQAATTRSMQPSAEKRPVQGVRTVQGDIVDLRWATFQEIDVLKAIDVTRHKIGDEWSKRDGVLYSPDDPFERIRMPYIFPEQYDLLIDLKPISGHSSFGMALPASTGHRFLASFNGQRPDFRISGIETINGVPSTKNSTRLDRKLFKEGQMSRVLVSVRRNEISVKVDDEPIIQYTGPQDALSCRGRGPWHDKEDLTAVLGTFESRFEFHRIALRSFTAETIEDYRSAFNASSGTGRIGVKFGDTTLPKEFAARSKIYLDEIPEAAFFVGAGTMGRRGEKGYGRDNRVMVGRKQLQHAISTHPPSDGAAHVQYHLDGQYKTLSIQPGVTDNGANANFDLQFIVYGDGRVLKQSELIWNAGIAEKWKIDVSGVDTLMLMVRCGKNKERACAIWANPLLEK